MKFLVDAQLPARLSELLSGAGHDALHTRELPDGNRSTDSQIARRADADERVVVTKDQDFRESHLLTGSPRQLLVVATGNLANDALLSLFSAFAEASFVQLTEEALLLAARPAARSKRIAALQPMPVIADLFAPFRSSSNAAWTVFRETRSGPERRSQASSSNQRGRPGPSRTAAGSRSIKRSRARSRIRSRSQCGTR